MNENINYLENTNLSWKSKGLLAYILSLPKDQVLSISYLNEQGKDGKTGVESGINELINNNYIQRYPVYNNKRITGYKYDVSEVNYRDKKTPPCIHKYFYLNHCQERVVFIQFTQNLLQSQVYYRTFTFS